MWHFQFLTYKLIILLTLVFFIIICSFSVAFLIQRNFSFVNRTQTVKFCWHLLPISHTFSCYYQKFDLATTGAPPRVENNYIQKPDLNLILEFCWHFPVFATISEVFAIFNPLLICVTSFDVLCEVTDTEMTTPAIFPTAVSYENSIVSTCSVSIVNRSRVTCMLQ